MRRLAMIGGAFVIAAVIAVCADSRSQPADTRQIDSLTVANSNLAHQNETLKAAVAQLTVSRDAAWRQRDSLKEVSDAATERLKKRRNTLPSPDVVPDSMLRRTYAEALVTLDSAFMELARKDAIIQQSKAAEAQSKAMEVLLQEHINNVTTMYSNAQQISADWKAKYEDAVKPRCGKKCGIIIGVIGTVTGAIVVRKVGEAFVPR